MTDGFGGAIVAWGDSRSDGGDVYAQRLDPGGNPVWGINGLPVCSAENTQAVPRITGDGNGGAIVAWGDQRPSPTNADLNVRGVTLQGGLFGPSSSLPVATAPPSGGQGWIAITPSVPGSAIVAWGDTRSPNNNDVYANLVTPQGITPPGVAFSYFVPQSGSLATPSEGVQAIANFRTCPNIDGTQVLRFNARLKIVLRTEDNTPLIGVTPDNICMLFNGGTPAQGFTGVGDDSIIANHQYNELANCPDVRCIQADTATDSTGSTYITLLGATPGSPGVATRDPNRKWGMYAGDVPIRALAVQLQGRLTSLSSNGSYTAHVRNVDTAGGTTTAHNFGERVDSLDKNPVQAAIGQPYKYRYDFDENGVVNSIDLNFLNAHLGDKCNSPNVDQP